MEVEAEVLERKREAVEEEMEEGLSALLESWTRSLGRSLISALHEAPGYLAKGSEVADGVEMEEGDSREAVVSRRIDVWVWSNEEETRDH